MKFWVAPHKNFSDQIGRFIFRGDRLEGLTERNSDNSFRIEDVDLAKYDPVFQESYKEVKALESVTLESHNQGVDAHSNYEQQTRLVAGSNNRFSENIERFSGSIGATDEALGIFIEAQALGSPVVDTAQIESFLELNGIAKSDPAYIRSANIVQNLLNERRVLAQKRIDLSNTTEAMTIVYDQIRADRETLESVNSQLQSLEREQAGQDIALQLLSLQEEIDVNNDGLIDVSEMPHDEQLAILNLVANAESITDVRLSDSRSDWSQTVDSWARTVENQIPEWAANMARRNLDTDDKVEFVSMLSPDIVAEFIRLEPNRAKDFFSDQVGFNSFRLDFMGNDYAEANINLTDLLPTDQHFARIESDTGEIVYAYRGSENQAPGYFNLADDSPIEIDTNFVVTGLGQNPGPQIQTILEARETDLPTYSAVEQAELEYQYQLASAESRLVNRIADVTTRRVYSHFGLELGAEITDADHEAFLVSAESQFGNLSFFETFSSSYQELRTQLSDPDTFKNSIGQPLSAADQSLLVTEMYEDFYEEAGAQMRESIAQLKASDDPRSRQQLETIEELMQIIGQAQTDVLTSEAAVLQEKDERIRAKLIEKYRFDDSQIDKLNEFIATNSRFTNAEIVEFLANTLGRREFTVNNGIPNRRLMSLLNDLGTIQRIQGENEALHARVEVQKMQQFMGMLALDPEVQAFVSLIDDNLGEEERALLESIYKGEIVDPRDHLTQLNALAIAISEQTIPEGVDHTFANILRNGQRKMTLFVGGTVEAADAADAAIEASQTAHANAEATTNVARTFEQSPDAVLLARAAIGDDGTIDTALLSVFDQPNPDFSAEGVQRLINLSQSAAYQNASQAEQAAMMAQTTNQPLSINADANTLASQYNFYLPPGVSAGRLVIDPSGETQGTFTSGETNYVVENDGTYIAEHLLGVPDAEDLRVPATEWATAQALGAMTDSFVVKSAAELAQAGETLGNRALVNFMKQYWGIRGNNTLPESELDKFKNLGEMMSDNHINLHTVLAQLNAVKWDQTAAGNRALDVRNQFNQILEAAAAGNNAGFRELLNLDNLPPEVPTTA